MKSELISNINLHLKLAIWIWTISKPKVESYKAKGLANLVLEKSYGAESEETLTASQLNKMLT